MGSQCIRVLQVVGKMDRAGAETLLMNLYRHIDRSRIQFDFLTHRLERGDYDAEILKLGGNVYHLCAMSVGNALKYGISLNKFFREHPEYHIIHSHIDAMSVLPLFGAKKAGVPVRIAHSHNTGFPWDGKYPLRLGAKALLPFQATHYCACSNEAAQFLFPKNVFRDGRCIILRNAIELDRFTYCNAVRKKKRAEMGIAKDTLVVGHVGRFCKQKNHERLVHIFARIHQQYPKSILILAGQGELQKVTVALCEQLKILDSVCFLGVCEDVDQLMQVFDLFLLPSLYEGVPVVGIEAQAAGLPCLMADSINRDVAISDKVAFLPLKESDTVWAAKALELCQESRTDNIKKMRDRGFDIQQQASALEKFYLQLANDT